MNNPTCILLWFANVQLLPSSRYQSQWCPIFLHSGLWSYHLSFQLLLGDSSLLCPLVQKWKRILQVIIFSPHACPRIVGFEWKTNLAKINILIQKSFFDRRAQSLPILLATIAIIVQDFVAFLFGWSSITALKCTSTLSATAAIFSSISSISSSMYIVQLPPGEGETDLSSPSGRGHRRGGGLQYPPGDFTQNNDQDQEEQLSGETQPAQPGQHGPLSLRGEFWRQKNNLKKSTKVSQEGPIFATDSKFGDLLIVVVPRHGPSIIGGTDRWVKIFSNMAGAWCFQVPSGRESTHELHLRGESFLLKSGPGQDLSIKFGYCQKYNCQFWFFYVLVLF